MKPARGRVHLTRCDVCREERRPLIHTFLPDWTPIKLCCHCLPTVEIREPSGEVEGQQSFALGAAS